MSTIKRKSAKQTPLVPVNIHVTISNELLIVSYPGTSFGCPLTNMNSYMPVVVR